MFGKVFSVESTAPRAPRNSYLLGEINAANAAESVSELSEFSRDYSGYVRQAAVDRCAVLCRPERLSIVVGRLNDWVPAVRQAAREAVIAMSPKMLPAQLLAILPAIHHLHTAGRTEHTQWIEAFEKGLIRLIDLQDILTATRGNDVKVARASFHLLRKYRLQDPLTLLRLILAAKNDILLTNEAVSLVRELPSEAQRPHYLLALTSHFGSVRTIALRALLAVEDASNMALATGALLDLQASVRDVAAAFMRSKDFNIRLFYRDILQRQPPLSVKETRVVLAALAELRSPEDLALVKAHASHAKLSVRRAALMAWIRMSPNEKDDVAFAALMDDALPLRKFALQAVRKHGAYLPFVKVRTRLSELGDLALLLLFTENRVWDGLDCIAQAAMVDVSDAQRKQQLSVALREWIFGMRHRYELPSKSQRAFFLSPATMAVFGDLLDNDKHLVQRLESELRG